jgi:hypothetical protein
VTEQGPVLLLAVAGGFEVVVDALEGSSEALLACIDHKFLRILISKIM